MAALLRIPPAVKVERTSVEGLPAAWIRPAGADPDTVLLHLHGGGYVTGGINSHLMMCVPLALTLKTNILLPEYKLAPENPYPAALEDALKVYRGLLAKGFRPDHIVVTGNSAGGGLSLASVLALRDHGDPLPAAVVCFSPWADLTHSGRVHVSLAGVDVVLNTQVLKEWALLYADAASLSQPLVSPVYADFHGFPPLLIQVGSQEVLLDDALCVAEKAKAAGVDVTLKVWDALWHVWPALGDLIPESRQAFEQIGEFIRAKMPADK